MRIQFIELKLEIRFQVFLSRSEQVESDLMRRDVSICAFVVSVFVLLYR